MKKNPLDVQLLVPRVLVHCFPPSFLLNALTGPSGKSTFLYYMLLHLLSSGQSVVFCPHRIYYVFTSSGVYTPKGNTEGVFKNPIYNGVPALIDAQHTSALEVFSVPIMKVYTVLATSPRDQITKTFLKQRHAATFIPQAPSRAEAFAV